MLSSAEYTRCFSLIDDELSASFRLILGVMVISADNIAVMGTLGEEREEKTARKFHSPQRRRMPFGQ